jgi:hypothetical protein
LNWQNEAKKMNSFNGRFPLSIIRSGATTYQAVEIAENLHIITCFALRNSLVYGVSASTVIADLDE